MEDKMLEQAREVLRLEAEAVLEQVERIDEHFKAAVEMIMACHGRVVITGMGKSGIIGRKMAATLASTGGCHAGQHRHAVLLPAPGRGHPRRFGHGNGKRRCNRAVQQR